MVDPKPAEHRLPLVKGISGLDLGQPSPILPREPFALAPLSPDLGDMVSEQFGFWVFHDRRIPGFGANRKSAVMDVETSILIAHAVHAGHL
jgi:hypothetical protein